MAKLSLLSFLSAGPWGGHETTAASRVVADVLNIHPDMVLCVDRVRHRTHGAHGGGVQRHLRQSVCVSGLSACTSGLETEERDKRLAASLLKTGEEIVNLEWDSRARRFARKILASCRESTWHYGHVVNVNSAVLPEELYELTLNCRTSGARPSKFRQ